MRYQLQQVIFKTSLLLAVVVLLYGVNQKIVGIRHQQQLAHNLAAQEHVLGLTTQSVSQPLPIRLKIPAIKVDTSIEQVGITSAGAMDVPSNTVNVGWFKLGARPGEQGSAVIAGHFNGVHGEVGVFAHLSQLKAGDKISVENEAGKLSTFIVRESRTYSPGYADEVFSQNDGSHLNLITCDGVWDETKKSYSERLVVFADIIGNK